MSLAVARRVADAVLYEGYLLYPYRATSPKNQVRWQFGIVGPVGAAEAGVGEEPTLQTECLLELSPGATPRVDVQLRFLQVQARTVERADPDTGFAATAELEVGGARWIGWHEAVERQVDLADLVLGDLVGGRTAPVEIPGGVDVELLTAGSQVVGRLVRTRWALHGTLHLRATAVEAGLYRLLVGLSNETPLATPDAADIGTARDVAARGSFVSTHLILAAAGAGFVSLTDPPDRFAPAAAACTNTRCWPVLVGDGDARDTVLAAPIILPDRPAVAPESPGDLFDLTEIDEILTLRVMTMTDDEKLAARGTDPRAAAIIDRCDDMSPGTLDRLHGAVRSDPFGDVPTFGDVPAFGIEPDAAGKPWWDPGVDASVAPDRDHVMVAGVAVAKGSRVVLRPSRRADAQDLFLVGMAAVVAAVYRDVEGGTHVAVTLADDPAADLHDWYGRYYYFAPDELEPVR